MLKVCDHWITVTKMDFTHMCVERVDVLNNEVTFQLLHELRFFNLKAHSIGSFEA